MSQRNAIEVLPDELIELIVYNLPPDSTTAFGSTSKRANKITYEPLVWRRHCVQTWRYWNESHDIEARLKAPPVQTKWRNLYNKRRQTDKYVLEIFNGMLWTQKGRISHMESIAKHGYDVKDLMLKLRDQTPDAADDVLARRYYANAILGQLHRATALEKWTRLQKRQMVALEEVLGAYDLFVLGGQRGDLGDIANELDRIAAAIQRRDDEWDDRSIRYKAVQIAKFLRSENLVGNPDQNDYHALRNNFVSLALFDPPHTSLPLQSVAIYCSVARRLGVSAKPSNYPHHVHAVIEAPQEVTLDGRPREVVPGTEQEPEMMHMDPWRSHEEVPRQELTLRLSQMGAPPASNQYHLGAASTLEIALRTGRNIMNSVQEARDRQRGTSRQPPYPDVEAAWYSMLWSLLVLGDSNANTTLHRRRQVLPYLIEHYQAHFPEDLNLIETMIMPMFDGEREAHVLMHLITTARAGDRNARPKNSRDAAIRDAVRFKVGQQFQHKRYGYEGMIIGWDVKCSAEARWMEQMRVDDLPRGRHQPFYNVVADDKSVRYVAEENISVMHTPPSESLLRLAGRWFKRWDDERQIFISNIKDEYPDD